MKYIPRPIDTSGVELPEELLKLTEQLAENAHDVWAAQRFKEGWSHGVRRDDVLLTHPDLVSFKELSESEKEYDRKTAIETLKAIMALGYGIAKKVKSDR